ncbi:hypothetical protein [Enterococcus faecalis]|uniref:hypothetical protein n=1 Tax=Enterococcus faecalis TaxID=1351 RepID=UPI000415E3FE|nr:hypothetical protein [Enterococcus faecalis]
MTPKEAAAHDYYYTTPPEDFYEEEIDETLDYDKDSMGETIAQEDGVFQVLYKRTNLNSKLHLLEVRNELAIVT